MLRKNPEDSGQDDLYRSRLEAMIDLRHGLVRLGHLVDWAGLECDLSRHYCADNGRPGGSIRLMAGLLLLKELKGLSDEEVCETWRENPYFQYFCGEEFFQHRLPVLPPSLSIFRKRIGAAGEERLLKETIAMGLVCGVVTHKDLRIVTVDTTVQEKAVRFPTDTALCHKARLELVKLAQAHGIALRQSYARVGKHAVFMANKYMAARKVGKGRAMVRKVRGYLGRVMRDIERAIARVPELGPALASDLAKARKIYAQAANPKEPDKIYSWHAPEVECIAKGKAHKKYEFGCKASLAATTSGNFMVGAMAHHGRPYDAHTLAPMLAQLERLTGTKPDEVHADQGYRGHKIEQEDVTIILSRHKRGVTRPQKKRQKRRNAIEPIIGHCKNDRKTGPRNWLKGKRGDEINAIAMAVGFNLRKILAWLLLWLIEKLRLIFQAQPKNYEPQDNPFFRAD
jgi:IS5 family transposase